MAGEEQRIGLLPEQIEPARAVIHDQVEAAYKYATGKWEMPPLPAGKSVYSVQEIAAAKAEQENNLFYQDVKNIVSSTPDESIRRASLDQLKANTLERMKNGIAKPSFWQGFAQSMSKMNLLTIVMDAIGAAWNGGSAMETIGKAFKTNIIESGKVAAITWGGIEFGAKMKTWKNNTLDKWTAQFNGQPVAVPMTEEKAAKILAVEYGLRGLGLKTEENPEGVMRIFEMIEAKANPKPASGAGTDTGIATVQPAPSLTVPQMMQDFKIDAKEFAEALGSAVRTKEQTEILTELKKDKDGYVILTPKATKDGPGPVIYAKKGDGDKLTEIQVALGEDKFVKVTGEFVASNTDGILRAANESKESLDKKDPKVYVDDIIAPLANMYKKQEKAPAATGPS